MSYAHRAHSPGLYVLSHGGPGIDQDRLKRRRRCDRHTAAHEGPAHGALRVTSRCVLTRISPPCPAVRRLLFFDGLTERHHLRHLTAEHLLDVRRRALSNHVVSLSLSISAANWLVRATIIDYSTSEARVPLIPVLVAGGVDGGQTDPSASRRGGRALQA
jgi:hypothetical protein